MKKMKLLTFALAALFAGNAMAGEYVQDGTKSYSIPYTFESSSVTIKAEGRFKVEQKQMWNASKAYGIKLANSANDNIDTAYIEISSADELITGLELSASTNSSGAGKKYSILYCSVAPFDKEYIISGEEKISISKDSADVSRIFTVPEGTMSARLYRKVNYNGKSYGEGSSVYIYNFKITTTPTATNIATLKAITVDGEALEGFSAATKEYNVELPFGTTEVPTVIATTTSAKANAVVTPAAALPGATTILVTAEDGETNETYTINFTVAASASDDATLAELMVDGKAIAGFRADSLDYAYEAAYSKNMPVVTATANDENAVVAITQITAFPATATILVTAQAGNTLTYKIEFTQAAAPKVLLEVVFSNGAKGAIKDAVISVPYLQGEAIPTIVSFKTADSTMTADEIEGGIRVTGADNTTLDYSIRTVELAPLAFTTNVITFDSTETYIFDPYGFDSSKGWKFAKNIEEADNRRVSEGRTRIYFALPAAKEVRLTSGTSGARAIKVYVNGIENTAVTKTAAKNESITIALNATSANLVAIESNQTGGDGGFIQLQLVPNIDTALENAAEAIVVEKTIIDGQLVIIKNGLMYNAQGIRLN